MEKVIAWRNDAYIKVTGKAKYADDIKVFNQVHGVPVYSNYVHARILSINTSEAEKYPGVLKVLTHADVTGNQVFGQITKDYHFFASDKIRYNGDVIALVVAETRDIAVQAAKLVTLEAEELPRLLDPEEALTSSNLIHEHLGTNQINEHKVRRGDTNKGFADSTLILEKFYQTQHIEHSYMEPESGIAIPRDDGVMEIYGSMQHPFSTRRFTAAILGCKLSEVEVRSISMGGGFGGKDDTAALVCARAALAAKILNRPVKITYTREWSVKESYKRHPYKVYYKMGLDTNGIIKACDIRIYADGGAYCSVTPWVTWRSTVQCCGPYTVENVHCDTFGVYTNNVFTGAMRGFGSPQLNFVVETLIEEAATKLNIDSTELRRRNMVRQGSTTITGQVLDTHPVTLEKVMDTVLTEIDFSEKYKNCNFGVSDSNNLYGIGYAISYRGMSLGAEGMDFNPAIVNVQFDGSILLEAGVHENGQGSESALILLLAEELGVSKDRIRYRKASTSNIPDGGTTVASRGTIMGGGAVVLAARTLKKKLAGLLCQKLECQPEEVQFEDDKIFSKTQSLTFEEAMHQLFLLQEYPYSFETFKAPKVSWDEETGQGNAYFTWVYACQAVELTVDKTTNKVKLNNIIAAHEVGKAVNPPMVLGQIYGGLAMSAGYALHEKLQINEGVIESLNFHKYKIPRANDLPEMKAIIFENYDPTSPSGAKGLGEPVNELLAPAIANAIYNATGKRYYSLPIKPV